jgi:CrcB protein
MVAYLWIALGSALGGMARYWCAGFVGARLGNEFPWGTVLINVLGSFVIGFFATLSGPDGRLLVGDNIRLFVMVGLCGGYTTFSAFSLQTLDLIRAGNLPAAGGNIAASVILCLIFVALGHAAASLLNQARM